jgi:hypothetical protein
MSHQLRQLVTKTLPVISFLVPESDNLGVKFRTREGDILNLAVILYLLDHCQARSEAYSS